MKVTAVRRKTRKFRLSFPASIKKSPPYIHFSTPVSRETSQISQKEIRKLANRGAGEIFPGNNFSRIPPSAGGGSTESVVCPRSEYFYRKPNPERQLARDGRLQRPVLFFIYIQLLRLLLYIRIVRETIFFLETKSRGKNLSSGKTLAYGERKSGN